MNEHRLPLLVQPAELADRLDEDGLRMIDLSPAEVFAEHHAPGAVQLAYTDIVHSRPPVGGLVPNTTRLETLFGQLGIGPDVHVIAMDAEGGGAAGRLLWTLELLGHTRVSLLDGGLRAWVREGLPIERGAAALPQAAVFTARERPELAADAGFILEHLGRADFALLDARTHDEFDGTVARAARGGHIPGAAHFEWTAGMDRERNLRMRPAAELRDELADRGLTPDREIIAYCHTHHRSAYSYAMLRVLGYERVRGYPGSWSEWGNRDDTPVE